MKKLLFITIFLIAGICFAANGIRAYYPSGSTLYAVIRNSTGQAFDTTGNAFEAWNIMTDYDIALTDKTGGLYLGDFDSGASAGSYSVIVHKQIGVNPADSDPPIQFEEGYWTGTVWKSSRDRLEDILEDTGTTLDTDIQSILSNQTVINNNITDSNSTVMAELSGLSVSVDANDIAVAVRTEMDANSTQLAAIVADTNEVQTDWADGGRLDTIFGSILTDTNEVQSKLPTNYIMGSSDVDNHDTDIDSVLEDTGTTIPALINDVNDNLETSIGNITVDNGAIADEVVLHMDANSTQLASIIEDTGTTLPAQINDINSHLDMAIGNINIDEGGIADEVVLHMDANSSKLSTINTATGTTIPNQITNMKSAMDVNFAAINTAVVTTIPGLIGALVVPDPAGTAAALIGALNNLSAAQVRTQADNALAAYDPPTKAELDSGLAALKLAMDSNFTALRIAMDANFANINVDFPTKEEIRQEIDNNSLRLALIYSDVNSTIPTLIGALVVPDAAGTAASLIAITNGKIDDLNDIAVADIWNEYVEGTYSYQDYMREMAAVIFGKFTGGNTATPSYYSPADLSKKRSTFTIGTGTRTPTMIDANN